MVYKRRVIRRRRRPIGRRHPVMKAVAKRVVKNALSRQVERKRLDLQIGDAALGVSQFYFINPLQHIGVGDTSSSRVGDKLANVRLQLGLMYYHVGTPPIGTTQLWQGSKLRILVIKSRRQVPTLSNAWSVKSPTDASGFPNLFPDEYHISAGPVNTHDYTVLYDRTISSNAPNGGGNFGEPVVHRMSIPLAKSWRYLDGDVYGKFSNIYILVGAQGVTGTSLDTIGELQASGYLSWTDA